MANEIRKAVDGDAVVFRLYYGWEKACLNLALLL
jgi:hypothetical protein